jgi:hypothetical protein
MQKSVVNFMRSRIKFGLNLLQPAHIDLFMRMYSPGNLGKSIETVVDDLAEEKLDNALGQVERTLKKFGVRLD